MEHQQRVLALLQEELSLERTVKHLSGGRGSHNLPSLGLYSKGRIAICINGADVLVFATVVFSTVVFATVVFTTVIFIFPAVTSNIRTFDGLVNQFVTIEKEMLESRQWRAPSNDSA